MRWVLTLFLVLGLGLTFFWLLDPNGTTPPPPSNSATSEGTGFTSSGVSAGGSAVSADFDGSTDGAPDEAPLVREDGTPVDTSQPGPTVLVVRGEQQEPVANAIVCFLAQGNNRYSTRGRSEMSFLTNDGQRRQSTRWEGPELFGKRLRTDQFGKVQLPSGKDRWLCSAMKDGEFGFQVLPARLGNHTITLGPDEELLIVAKHSGSPERPAAGVAVAVAQEYKTNRTSRIWRGTTDERGHAIVRHLQLLRRDVAKGVPKDFTERFAAFAMIPSSPPTTAEFEGRPLKQKSVQLALPPQGSILATLVDHSGKPLLSPARIGFGAPPQPQTPGDLRIHSGYFNHTVAKPVGSAPIEIPYAQVGMNIQLSARYPHDRRSAQSESTMGPTKVGQRVAIEIPPLARHTVFAGRFLHASGRGLASQKVALTIWRDDKVISTASADTIDDGQWDLVLSSRPEQARWRLEFRYHQLATDDDTTDTWLGAIAELPAWPPGKRMELGNIVLGELPPLAAGIVVDDEGNPIANASVNIQQEQPQAAKKSGTSNVRFGPNNGEIVYRMGVPTVRNFGSRAEPWRSVRNLAARTNADGTFRIHAPMPTGILRVFADTGDHASQSVPLAGPNTNLRIVLARNGVLMGRVLVPEWLPDGAVTVSVRAQQPHEGRASNATNRINKGNDGKFVLQPLRPGRYEVLVKMRNLKAPMATVVDVVVKPGINNDPRLQPLDLRQALFRYHLRAFDDGGQPFALDGPIQARFQQPDGSFVESGFRWQGGKAEMISVHPSAELTFFGRGFEPKKQQYGPGDHDVFLTKLRPALVQVAGARGLSGPTRKVRISAILIGDTDLPSSLRGVDQITGRSFSFARWDLGRSSGGWLEQTDLVEIPLMKAGKYQLLFRAHATESTKTPQTSVTLGTFELKPDGTTITNVPLNVQAISDALRAIDKQWQERLARNKKRSNR
tara:strand:- start:959 stop:3811 length:2853 start_codon:yes stop_codon:yes gene_type:complete